MFLVTLFLVVKFSRRFYGCFPCNTQYGTYIAASQLHKEHQCFSRTLLLYSKPLEKLDSNFTAGLLGITACYEQRRTCK